MDASQSERPDDRERSQDRPTDHGAKQIALPEEPGAVDVHVSWNPVAGPTLVGALGELKVPILRECDPGEAAAILNDALDRNRLSILISHDSPEEPIRVCRIWAPPGVRSVAYFDERYADELVKLGGLVVVLLKATPEDLGPDDIEDIYTDITESFAYLGCLLKERREPDDDDDDVIGPPRSDWGRTPSPYDVITDETSHVVAAAISINLQAEPAATVSAFYDPVARWRRERAGCEPYPRGVDPAALYRYMRELAFNKLTSGVQTFGFDRALIFGGSRLSAALKAILGRLEEAPREEM